MTEQERFEELRKRVPKLHIKRIGDINEDGTVGRGWMFDGNVPGSIGEYIDTQAGIHLIGGYTKEELVAIKRNTHQ